MFAKYRSLQCQKWRKTNVTKTMVVDAIGKATRFWLLFGKYFTKLYILLTLWMIWQVIFTKSIFVHGRAILRMWNLLSVWTPHWCEETTGKRQSVLCRRCLQDDNARDSGLCCERDLGSRQTLRDDNRLDSVLPSLQSFRHSQTLDHRLRKDNRRESALSNLPDLGHRQTVRCPVRDVDPAGSAFPSLQNMGRRQSLLLRLRDGKSGEVLLPNLRLGGRRRAVCDCLRGDKRH